LDRFERIAALGMANMHPGGLAATRLLAQWAGVEPGVRILDVGCGVGQTACLLAARYGADVVGLDRSGRMVERARERAGHMGVQRLADEGHGASFVEGDAYALPFDGESFDVVFAESVTLFLDRDRVLPELRRVLAPGGRVADVVMTCHEPVPPDVLDRFEALEGVRMEPLPAAAKRW
jgi:ubiquinone/menaquinone biosynthesis C-methylase UbiE